jgi:hypothetical protein
MKIENLSSEKRGNRARVSATVTWEDCDRPRQEVYFETDEAFAEGLSCNPHAFLVGCIMPAIRHEEARIFIDAEICPELRDGLVTAMSWIRHWFYDSDHKLVRIEAKLQSSLPVPRASARAGAFLSGGIDSLALLRANRLTYPPEHPDSIKDCLLVYGQNIESDARPEIFEQAKTALSQVTQEAGATLIPIYTNVRLLDGDTKFFTKQFLGAILASVGHALVRRLTKVYVASSHTISTVYPFGTHPLLDPNYSSYDLRIQHYDLLSSRLEKTKMVADWEAALQNIKVCGPNWPGQNCGQCEKCIRTMLELMALGVLDQTQAFPHDVSAELILSKINLVPVLFHKLCYQELIDPLAARGRNDLVDVIEYKITKLDEAMGSWQAKIKRLAPKYLRYYYRERGGWKAMLRRLDRRFFNGLFGTVKRLVF